MVPPLPDWVILRPRLLARLRKGARGPLTVVTGPPGSGKTVIVNSWAATDARAHGPIVWMPNDLTLSTAEGFCDSLRECLPRAGIQTRAVPGSRDLLKETASILAGLDGPVVLVLDDFRPEQGTGLADAVTFLLRHAGPGFHLVITARGDPPIPLRRYSMAGELTEIRVDDLSLDEAEMAAILAQHGVRLEPASLRALRERTEGWAAAVRLAAISMESHPDPDAFVEQFAGDDHAVVGYLMEEVLDAQPADLRRLLLSTSVVDRVNAALAAELAGDGAGRAFATLVRRYAFVMPEGHGWYRCHRMFREALRLVLQYEAPSEVPELNRRAAAWFDRRGLLTDAVHQAASAGDWRYAARLVVDRLAIGRVLGLRQADPLADLFSRMPGDLAFAGPEPEPAVVTAAAAVARGDERACAVALQHADRLLGDVPEEKAQAVRLSSAFVRLARHRPLDWAEGSGRAAELPGLVFKSPERLLNDRPELQALILAARAATALREGVLHESAQLFERAVAAATQAGGDFQRRSCLGYLALVEALLGRFAEADGLAARAAQLPEISVHPAGRRVAVAHLARAYVDLERYERKAAGDELGMAGPALRECPDPLLSMLGRLIGSRLEIARGRPERALRLLDVADEGAADEGAVGRVPWLRRRLRLAVAEAHVARGAADAAQVCAERAGGAGTLGSAVALAWARVCRGEPDGAAGLVRQALRESPGVPADVRVDAWLLEAYLAYQEDDVSNGRRSLHRALLLADRELIRLPFALARQWLHPVLRRDPELVRLHDRLLGPLNLDGGPPRAAGAGERETTTVGRLTSREFDVLRRLAWMMTTEEIAADLCLTVNTVKTHLKSIYRKLGVTRRAEAVRRARHLSLLTD
ncbi:LuxR C-terminal-related transcriptional regulator [Spirillospora sp. CA-255316]